MHKTSMSKLVSKNLMNCFMYRRLIEKFLISDLFAIAIHQILSKFSAGYSDSHWVTISTSCTYVCMQA